MKEFKWHEVKASGFKFGHLLEPQMLSEQGLVKIRTIKLKGNYHKETIKVVYDRSYVVAWLAWYFFRAMAGVKFNELQKLFGEGFALAKEAYEIAQKAKRNG